MKRLGTYEMTFFRVLDADRHVLKWRSGNGDLDRRALRQRAAKIHMKARRHHRMRLRDQAIGLGDRCGSRLSTLEGPFGRTVSVNADDGARALVFQSDRHKLIDRKTGMGNLGGRRAGGDEEQQKERKV